MSALEGAPCIKCNAGTLVGRVATQGQYAGQRYYACSNYQFHNEHKERGDPLKSPWILESDTVKAQEYLDTAAGKPPAKKAKAAAAPVAAFAKPAAKPAAAMINGDHVLVSISAKVARLESQLEELLGYLRPKNSTEPPAVDDDAE